jgi:hypothetical protein
MERNKPTDNKWSCRGYHLYRCGRRDGRDHPYFKPGDATIQENTDIPNMMISEVSVIADYFEDVLKVKTEDVLNKLQKEINQKCDELNAMMGLYPGIDESSRTKHRELNNIITRTTEEQARIRNNLRGSSESKNGELKSDYMLSVHEMHDAKMRIIDLMKAELDTIKSRLDEIKKLINSKKETIRQFSLNYEAIFRKLMNELRYYFDTAASRRAKSRKNKNKLEFPFSDTDSMLKTCGKAKPTFMIVKKVDANSTPADTEKIDWYGSDDKYCNDIDEWINRKENERQDQKDQSITDLENNLKKGE